MNQFGELIKAARKAAKKAGMKRRDVETTPPLDLEQAVTSLWKTF